MHSRLVRAIGLTPRSLWDLADNEPLDREGGNSPGEHRDGRHPSAARTAEPHGPGDEGAGKGPLEIVLLTIAWIAFFLPLIWIATPVFAFADYPLHPIPLVIGVLCLVLGLWLFHRSHADLGTNWSITLEVRENHQLVTDGVYRWVRHPMYLALLIYSAGPDARYSQLVGGSVLWRCHGSALRPPCGTRGAHDAGGIREGLRGIQVDDQAFGPRRLVIS